MAVETQNNKRELVELFLLSAVALYFELLVIRWISADFLAFTVFKTFPLVTCFVGLGVGFACQKNLNYFRLAPLAIMQFVALLKLGVLIGFDKFFFPSIGVWQWSDPTVFNGQWLWIYVALFTLILIVVLSGSFATMVCLGSRLGQLFIDIPPLTAYSVNIAGSIAGSVLFSAFTFAGLPPWFLLIPAALLIAYYAKAKWWLTLLPLAVTLVLAFMPMTAPGEVIFWSPYQKLSVTQFSAGTKAEDPIWKTNQGIVIGTNGSFYQYALDLRPSNLNNPKMPKELRDKLEEHSRHYNLPYKLKKPSTVLILGAGSGNDVAAALRNGAEQVDAVDIDPVILSLGQTRHPENPYGSSKVNRICDDARDFLNKCNKHYDMIIFAGLDSHTITGQGGSVRLDNYVYTKDSMQRALQLLNPDGLMIVSFCQSRPWLTQRLFSTINAAANYPPLIVVDQTNPELAWQIFISGPMVEKRALKINPAVIAPFALQELSLKDSARILTDDWPFVYVSPVIVDVPYLMVVFVIISLSMIAARKVLFAPTPLSSWQMFFLGAAFLLLELQSITRLSLLFGSTWYTSAIVINGVLLMILAANFIVIKLDDRVTSKLGLLYGLLILSLVISYSLPTHQILSSMVGFAGQMVVSTATIFPMFLAGIIFASSFKNVPAPDQAFAFNLLGAVAGAMLEYLSNFFGINSLVLIAAALYVASYLCTRTSVPKIKDSFS